MDKVIIIGEAGVNHNGSIETAKLLIDAAVEAKVDYVKFQTFNTDKSVTRAARKADYQIANMISSDDSQYDMLKKLELSKESHLELIEYCENRGVKFFSTGFDLESVEFLHTLGIGLWKVSSGDLTNYPLLKKISSYKEPVIISTGMSNLDEITSAVDLFKNNGYSDDMITILHCNTEYPTPMEDVNLKSIQTIASKFNVKIGYSDHTLGIEVPIAAVALGAQVIEKHFTLDKRMEGPDHVASLNPFELKQMVIAIRNIEKALGSGIKIPSESELKNMAIARKSIVASCKILEGDIYSEENLTVKRPGTGISPMKWEQLIGTAASRNYCIDDIIEENI